METLPIENSLVDKILARWKQCFAILAALFAVVLAITLRFDSSFQEYLTVQKAFVRFQENPKDAELFNKLERLLEKRPTLSQEYSARIAQTLIQNGLFDQASCYTSFPLQYLRKESPEHAHFAETTLLIEKGDYQGALEKAIRLKEQMGREETFLYAQNLLRIASLQKKLQNGPGELAALRDCEEFFSLESPSIQKVLLQYLEKNIDLRRYIQEQIDQHQIA